MREPLLVGSSILLPPNSVPLPHLFAATATTTTATKNHKSSSSYFQVNSSKHFPAKLSCSSSSSSSDSSTITTTAFSRPPLLMNVRQDITPRRGNRLKYYADLASKLAEDGRLEDFLMIVESVLGLGIDPPSFIGSLNIKLVSSGFSSVICDGRIQYLVEVLGRVDKLGLSPCSLFDESAKQSLALECRRLINRGELENVVGFMENLAGFGFSIKEFVDPSEMIRLCVEKRDPKMAVRYACILLHGHMLFSSIIQEFGKRRDLVSALTAYEASKCNGPNMYACRTIVDVCGLCGDSLRSRHIYEELLAQKVTPNTYVCNSLMNVNAHDLSYILHVYKHMQNIGVCADMASYNILLKACCLAGRVDLAEDIYKEVRDKASTGALKLDVITYSTIIKVFADAKMWQMALTIKEDMFLAGVTPNEVTWSSLITACANVGLVEQAIRTFEEMLLAGCQPNTQCCNTLLNACIEACQYDRAFRIFQSWKEHGLPRPCHPNEFSQNTGTEVCTAVGVSSSTTKPFPDPRRLRFSKIVPFKPTIATYNILMKACGTDYHRAKAIMEEMKIVGLSPNHISWSILIDIYGKSGDLGAAIQGLKSMRDVGIKPDVVAYTTVIKACVANKSLKIAFLLFEEMKRYQLQPNLVTYNTLLRARSKYGSLHEVQQSLAVYQDMRKSGYSSNDYFLKEIIEEWCEGVIQGSSQNPGILGLGGSRNKTGEAKSHSLLLEKVADYLQKDINESLAIDIRGLTKVEARIVILAVLRMIKENYAQGYPVKDDMIILLGAEKGVFGADSESELQDSVMKLLQDELGMSVLFTGPKIHVGRNDQERPLNSDKNLEKSIKFGSSARRPVVLRRLKVPRKSLYYWLQRRNRHR